MKKLTTKDFINISTKIHNNKYDYSLVEYNTIFDKVKIICPIHGIFEQVARYHMNGSNCKLCTNNNIKYTTEEFIEKSKKVHGNKYEYNLVDYINSDSKIKIICKEHGIFKQRPTSHLSGYGCSKCSNNYSSQENFIQNAINVHGNKYDYSFVDYKNNKTKVNIICHKHGLFYQRPDNHIGSKHNCPECGKITTQNKTKVGTDNFIKIANDIHNNKYDYSLVNYENNRKKVKIICPIHGTFEQSPSKHINNQGCPICSESIGEKKIRIFLDEYNIKYICQKKFKGCKNKYLLRFDFFIPSINTCIEFDGKQHYELNEYFGGIKSFEELKIKDEIKNQYCINNNIILIRLTDIKTIEEILKSKLNRFIY